MTERESRAWHQPGQSEVYDLSAAPDAPPVINLCNAILLEAAQSGATRVRVLPTDSFGDVTYEIDGTWRPVMRIPIKVLGSALNRLKVMADLDIAKRPSQAGRLSIKVLDRVITARLTVNVASTNAEEALIAFDVAQPRPAV